LLLSREYTSSGEKALNYYWKVIFLTLKVINEGGFAQRPSIGLLYQEVRDCVLAGHVVSYRKVRWAVSNFNA
jgi:hypothetical protein